MKKKNIIVTGGAGFVGASLIYELIEQNYNVHVFVRKTTSLTRLLPIIKNVTIHIDVLSSQKRTTSAIKKIHPFAICHLATYGAYPSQQDHTLLLTNNITSTLYLLEAIKEFPCEYFLAAGSSSEYGKKIEPMKENDILEPNNLYAAAKAMQSHIIQVYAKQYKIPATILRLFNVYGPMEESGRLVRSVIESSLTNKDISLASGKEARDFIYVEDVAKSFCHFLQGNKYYGEIFNIGTGKQTTIQELATLVLDLTKSSSRILLHAYEGRVWDSTTWRADMKKTYQYTNWRPETSVFNGIEKTITWYKKHI